MRYREFRITESAENVVVIGDSIATGIATAGGVSTQYTNPGKDTTFILQNLVTPFVKSGKAKGSVVILSSGAANSSKVELEDGTPFQKENFGPISTQIKMLKDAGATVLLVGVASGKTSPQNPTQYTKGKRWTIDYTGANNQLASIASSSGAKFLGPLEQFDPRIGAGDGIHPYNGYKKLFQAGASTPAPLGNKDAEPGAPRTKDKVDIGGIAAFDQTGKPIVKPKDDETKGKNQAASPTAFSVETPKGRRGPEIADAQKALVAFGYPLPKHGVDGIMGPETSGAIKKFQANNQLSVTGVLDDKTVEKLNSKPELLANLKKSTTADVKTPDFSKGAADLDALSNDEKMVDAKASAEKFLGKSISDKDWNYLIRATTAEASNNSKEQAYVMGVILNRTRSGRWGDSIASVLMAPMQFQAVTGTKFEPGPSANFSRGPTKSQLTSILTGATDILPGVNKNLMYFTAANLAAYGPGTNPKFRDTLLGRGGEQIGQTIFSA